MDALTYDEPNKTKKAILRKIEEQGEELAYLQRKARELGIPVLVVVEGLSAAGKGTIINHMIQRTLEFNRTSRCRSWYFKYSFH